jgi:hypothetical protein
MSWQEKISHLSLLLQPELKNAKWHLSAPRGSEGHAGPALWNSWPEGWVSCRPACAFLSLALMVTDQVSPNRPCPCSNGLQPSTTTIFLHLTQRCLQMLTGLSSAINTKLFMATQTTGGRPEVTVSDTTAVWLLYEGGRDRPGKRGRETFSISLKKKKKNPQNGNRSLAR